MIVVLLSLEKQISLLVKIYLKSSLELEATKANLENLPFSGKYRII